jgi:hypothetical protein
VCPGPEPDDVGAAAPVLKCEDDLGHLVEHLGMCPGPEPDDVVAATPICPPLGAEGQLLQAAAAGQSQGRGTVWPWCFAQVDIYLMYIFLLITNRHVVYCNLQVTNSHNNPRYFNMISNITVRC